MPAEKGHDLESCPLVIKSSKSGFLESESTQNLARDRRVKIPKTKIDYAEWQTVIDGISKKIEELAKARRGPKKSEALDFYRGALGEFYAFKDAWRNHVMHSRVRYDEHQALSAYQHVSEFMKRLSSKLSEAKISPIAWRL